MRGAGIALALSLAGLVNTVLLCVFLTKKSSVGIGAPFIRGAIAYILKITAFSALATLPVLALGPSIRRLFAGHSRLVTWGGPLLATGLLFAATGILLLTLSRDKYLRSLASLMHRHGGRTG
jgi:peptidoglycan biosynthesis protein MviN/MurJ (putative lipid II flippase)